MSHKPVCSKCQLEMEPHKNGVHVIEHSYRGPYKIWEADEWRCRKCDAKVILGFGHNPVWEHLNEGFDQAVAKTRADSKTLRLCFENEDQRAEFAPQGARNGEKI